MTGRKLFKILYKFQFIFYPVIITGQLWRTLNISKLMQNFAIVWRYYFYKKGFKNIGCNVSIHKNVILKHLENISIGNNVSIHTLCYIDGEGGISIGDNVSIAHNTSIISFNHTWQDPETPIKYNPLSYAGVVIHNDVWIGAGVRIMAGITIGQRCVIAAGSVITKDCESGGLYAGIPAKKIKNIKTC